jgi:hypothetical protein
MNKEEVKFSETAWNWLNAEICMNCGSARVGKGLLGVRTATNAQAVVCEMRCQPGKPQYPGPGTGLSKSRLVLTLLAFFIGNAPPVLW